MKTFGKAFTLIELLIVITIIGILAVAFLPSVTAGPSRARDVQRTSDLKDTATAMEVYYQDFGEYPAKGTKGMLDANVTGSDLQSTLGSYFDNGKVPTDPTPSSSFWGMSGVGQYYYEVSTDGQSYLLAADPENPKATDGYYYFGSNPTAFAMDEILVPAIPKYVGGDPDGIKYLIIHRQN